MKVLTIAAIAAVALVSHAHAATFSGSTTGQFTGTDPVSANVDITADGLTAIWPGENCIQWYCTDQSTLTIDTDDGLSDGNDNFDFSYDVVEDGSYLVGGLHWYNAASFASITDDMFNLLVDLSIDIDKPSDLAASTQDLTFNINNTTNPAGDIILGVTGLTYSLSLPLDLGDGLILTGFSFILAEQEQPAHWKKKYWKHWKKKKQATCTNSYFDGGVGEWTLSEKCKSSLEIYADIEVSPIPLPAAGWLLIAGLGGLAVAGRKKRTAA